MNVTVTVLLADTIARLKANEALRAQHEPDFVRTPKGEERLDWKCEDQIELPLD